MSNIEQTTRWWFATFIALFATAIGALVARPAPMLIGLVGLVYAGYARAGIPSEPSLELDRTLSSKEPLPGEDVTVTVTVTNTGGLITDLRIVDGVPAGLEVIDGSPRHATALRSGESATFAYSIRADRGEHGFQSAHIIVGSPGGRLERELDLRSETILTCLPTLTEVPLQGQTSQYTGRIVTDIGGSGIELHATREYHPGDALSRIDWNRHARSGELATIEFREERAATVMLVIDTRSAAYWGRSVNERNAVSHAVSATGRVFAELLAGGDRVGITAITDRDETCWLAPGAGSEHAHRARRLLATHPALSAIPPDDGPPDLVIDPEPEPIDIDRMFSRLSADTQLMFLTPLLDDGIVDAVRRVAGYGSVTTVISPDVTRTDTPGRRLARHQRRNRIHALREREVRVIDWNVESDLLAALERTRAES